MYARLWNTKSSADDMPVIHAPLTANDHDNAIPHIVPASGIVATRNRPESLARMFESLAKQSSQPAELIVVDASDEEKSADVCRNPPADLATSINYQRAAERGAAPQRNQAIAHATQSVVWFMDDDILFEPDCVARLYSALFSDPKIGGANATIVNQCYHHPGRTSRLLYRIFSHDGATNWAGRLIGPVVNFLPQDDASLPEVVPVDWLNTTCTMYRRDALPDNVFPAHFQGYSLMEDVALSLTVGRNWRLVNARTARIEHRSQPGDHKADPAIIAEMQLVNRHFVMTNVLGHRRIRDYAGLLAFEALSMLGQLRSPTARTSLLPSLRGRLRGLRKICVGRKK